MEYMLLVICWQNFIKLNNIKKNILLGYSQGGLLSRAAVQSFSDHNVKKLISLSSPQAGQYGGNNK